MSDTERSQQPIAPFDGSGWITVTREEVEADLARGRVARSGLPHRYRQRLATLRHDFGDGHDERREDALRAACDLVRAARRGEPLWGLYIEGPVGCGKTMLLGALTFELCLSGSGGQNCIWRSYLDWRREVMARYGESARYFGDAPDPMDLAIEAPILAWDDLGPEAGVERRNPVISDDAYDKLRQVVSARYVAERPTLVTSNLSLAEMRRWLGGDNVIMSRLCEGTRLVDMSGMPDLRRLDAGEKGTE